MTTNVQDHHQLTKHELTFLFFSSFSHFPFYFIYLFFNQHNWLRELRYFSFEKSGKKKKKAYVVAFSGQVIWTWLAKGIRVIVYGLPSLTLQLKQMSEH